MFKKITEIEVMGSKLYNIVSITLLILFTAVGWVWALHQSQSETTMTQVARDNAQDERIIKNEGKLEKIDEKLIQNDKDHQEIKATIQRNDDRINNKLDKQDLKLDKIVDYIIKGDQ